MKTQARKPATGKYARYRDECAKRWGGRALVDAVSNWQHFREHHAALVAAMKVYHRNPCQIDLCGKWHTNGTLTEFLWKLQEAWQPDRRRLDPLLDFCEYYQRVHLRRGLLVYCQMILEGFGPNNKEQAIPPATVTNQKGQAI